MSKRAAALASALCFVLPNDGAAPEWIELIPAPGADGVVRGQDGRSWLFRNAQAVAANFGSRLPIDINHSTELKAPKGEDSPAVGWIEQLEARNGALWGRVSWTERGAQALNGREYRFVSPVFTYERESTEIVRLTSAALVNNPNLPLALNSAGAADPSPEPAPMSLKAILAALKLADTATEADAVNAIHALNTQLGTALNAAQTPDLAKFVPRADYDLALNARTAAETALATERRAKTDAVVNSLIDQGLKEGKITPATVEYHRANCAREGGIDALRTFLSTAPVVAPASDKSGNPPPAATALNAEQVSAMTALGIDETAFRKANGL